MDVRRIRRCDQRLFDLWGGIDFQVGKVETNLEICKNLTFRWEHLETPLKNLRKKLEDVLRTRHRKTKEDSEPVERALSFVVWNFVAPGG